MDQHETAAADIAGGRIGDGEREADRDRGVDRVAAFLQHGDADVRSNRLHRDHHAVPRAHRLAGAERRDGDTDEEDDRDDASTVRHVHGYTPIGPDQRGARTFWQCVG